MVKIKSTAVHLQAMVFAQSRLVPWNEGVPEPAMPFDHELPASRPLAPDELANQYVPLLLKPADVPRGLGSNGTEPALQTWYQSQSGDLGRSVQYVFSDGLILTASQLLRHPHSTLLPRALWPVLLNIPNELRGDHAYFLKASRETAYRSNWLIESEKVLFGVLFNASRLAAREDFHLFLTLNDDPAVARRAMRLHGIQLALGHEGHWRLRTYTETSSNEHTWSHSQGRGLARLQLEFPEGEEEVLRTRNFTLGADQRVLRFHSLWNAANRVRARIEPMTEEATQAAPTLELRGHAHIQASVVEINEALRLTGAPEIEILPARTVIPASDITPRLLLNSDGSFHLNTHLRTPWGAYEIAGLPPAMTYLAMNLLNGLGATTGLANSQLAHKRRGIKRDRDMRLLKHLGYASLIFFEAANFGLGLPLSDGTRPTSIEELLRTLGARLGALLLKAEGWPAASGNLDSLCSANIMSLLEGFVRQVVRDCDESRVHLYLPEGELALEHFPRRIVIFYHALVADLAHSTAGGIFERARTKFFDDFWLERRENSQEPQEPQELTVYPALSTNPMAQAFAAGAQQGTKQPVYLLPEASRPPLGHSLFALSEHGFLVFFDGQAIETLQLDDFRPEFTLNEESPLLKNDTRHINWFELHPKFFFKGVEISAEQAARLSRDGVLEFRGRIYRLKPKDLPSLERLQTFWEKIQSGPSVAAIRGRRKTEETYYPLPRSQTLELLALRASGVSVSGGPRWQKICEFYDHLDAKRDPPALPSSFQATLKGYQQSGVRWFSDLFDLGLGAILADDMGLGKTVTTLAFLELLRSQNRMGRCLVVVPTSLTYNWSSEIERFAPGLKTMLFQGRQQEGMLDFLNDSPDALVITTYGLLQEHVTWFAQTNWNIIVFDEAQNLKNIAAKRTTAARQLNAAFKICLTGTPLENHYGEFYSLVDLILPGGLGTLASFREKYVNPGALLREDVHFLRLQTKPLVLRRTKNQVMQELPAKIETTVKLPFEAEQKRIYRDIAASYNEQVHTAIRSQGEAKTQLQMLTALLRLRQACSDPASIPNIRYHGEPPKLSVLLEALTEILESGESALVFTQFLATFQRIKDALTAARLPHFEISGSDPRAVREKRLQGFRDATSGAVMLMTLKTGGVGLNLTKASYVFHVEPWWNPAVENQATDRAHRIGQEKTVQVYRYIIRESVEEKIEVLKEIKGQRFNALFTEAEGDTTEVGSGGGHLSQADFDYLLG